MAYTNNAFCWTGVISTDTAAARDFYSAVLPWTVVEADMGGDPVTMFAAGDVPRLHLGTPQMEGVPSHFDNYLRVADVDALTAKAVDAGGAQLVPPTDIPPGRFSVVTSPSGAAVCLFHEADESTAQDAPAGPGAVHWVELHSHDIAADRAWLETVFGYEITEMPMPNGPYYLLNDGGGQRGGMMQAMSPQAPSMWLTWIQVPDVDETIATAKGKGGRHAHGPDGGRRRRPHGHRAGARRCGLRRHHAAGAGLSLRVHPASGARSEAGRATTGSGSPAR